MMPFGQRNPIPDIHEIGSNSERTDHDSGLVNIVAHHALPRAPFAFDVGTETLPTHLLGVASDAAEVLVDPLTLSSESRHLGGHGQSGGFIQMGTQAAKIRSRTIGDHETQPRQGEGKKDTKENQRSVVHGAMDLRADEDSNRVGSVSSLLLGLKRIQTKLVRKANCPSVIRITPTVLESR